MAQQINAEITINGSKIEPFSHLSLQQAFNEHHYFEFRFNYDVLEDAGAMIIDKAKNYLGKSVTISLNDLYSPGTANTFKGVITDVRFFNTLDASRDIVFSGYSPSILLDAGETNSSHLRRTLTQVVKDVSKDAPGNLLSIKTQPVKSAAIPYIVQYRESNFDFIRRLAAEYGEHFFYDGAALNFGKPSAGGAVVNLVYPNNISDMNLRVKVAPVSSDEWGYLSKTDQKTKSPASGATVAGLDTFGKFALKESDNIFKSKSTTLSPRKFLEKSELDESVKIAKSKAAGGLVVLSAKSDWPFVKIGGTIQVKTESDGNTSTATDYGKYMVISVTHKTDGLGNYENEFEAIPEAVTVVPNPYYKKPLAEPQIGVVTELKDPDNMGKVKVKLLWQEDEQATPYIRVLTPNAGVYGDGKKTRGHFFTPEVDDYVIVGFTQNDPDRPFVMGAFPHGKAISSSESTEKNNVKSISTRNGNIISFTDKDKENIIKIQTDDTNYMSIHLKDKDGTIQIYSSKAIEVNSKETIVVKAGKSIEVQGDKTIDIKSEKITIEATDTITLKANKKIEIKATDVAIEGSKGFEAKGGATAKIEGAQLDLSGSATAKLAGGAKTDVTASGIMGIKGALVQIN